MNAIMVGADPEVFMQENGRIISAIGRVPGTKTAPYPVPLGAVQVDNVLAEFNINPAASREEFVRNIKEVLASLRGMGDIVVQASHEFSDEELAAFPKEAFVFGCDPDYCCYTGDENPKPKGPKGLRTAGGHIHVGYDVASGPESYQVVAAMDIVLGLPSVFMDTDNRRRILYGKAGAFRPKPYGVEYRTLSNFWLGSDELISWAYRSTVEAFNRTPELFEKIKPVYQDVQRAINEGDVKLAKHLMEYFNVHVKV